MFISRISVQNFGVIGDKTIHLQDGLIVIRGRNGAGKSTMLKQAPMYAFFGASTLDAPIADTIKFGEKSLQVEADYGPYTVTRSKSSASVVGNGVKISGQVEVSDFFYDLFGIKKGVAEDILVSSQGDTAGIISRKAGEITSFIESIAGFSQIDELIERVRTKFPSSNISLIKELVETDSEAVRLLGKELVEKQGESPTISEQEREIFIKVAGIGWSRDAIAGEEAAIAAKRILLKAAIEKNHSIDLKDAEIVRDTQKSLRLGDELNSVTEAVNTFTLTDDKVLEEAKNILLTSEQMKKDLAAYQWVTSLTEPVNVWEGDTVSFDKEATDIETALKEKKKSKVEAEFELKNLKSSIVRDKNCKECGQDVTHLHAVLNLKNTLRIGELEVTIKGIEDAISSIAHDFNILAAIDVLHNKRYAAYQKYDQSYFTVGKSTVPFTYTWAKPSVPATIDDSKVIEAATTVTAAKKAVEALALLVKARDAKTKEINEHAAAASAKFKERKSMGEKIEDIPVLEAAITAGQEKIALKRNALTEVEATVADMKKTLAVRVESITNLIKNVEDKKEALQKSKDKLKAEERNAKMLKNLRDSKPIVMNKVWSAILDNTSQTYSSILGREIAIDKSDKGFKINGLPVSRLSGSEQDVLGIVVRSVIRDVFAPQAGFITLDEPTASSDADRTFAVMGALQMLSGQRIVITHSDLLESFADQLVEIK